MKKVISCGQKKYRTLLNRFGKFGRRESFVPAGLRVVEDCGGPDGLKQLARSFAKKKGAEYEQNREWLGMDDLNLEAFDLEDMNFRVKKIPRIYADMYEWGLPPTKASENLLARKYKEKC